MPYKPIDEDEPTARQFISEYYGSYLRRAWMHTRRLGQTYLLGTSEQTPNYKKRLGRLDKAINEKNADAVKKVIVSLAINHSDFKDIGKIFEAAFFYHEQLTDKKHNLELAWQVASRSSFNPGTHELLKIWKRAVNDMARENPVQALELVTSGLKKDQPDQLIMTALDQVRKLLQPAFAQTDKESVAQMYGRALHYARGIDHINLERVWRVIRKENIETREFLEKHGPKPGDPA